MGEGRRGQGGGLTWAGTSHRPYYTAAWGVPEDENLFFSSRPLG
jgi:hypothetical protein